MIGGHGKIGLRLLRLLAGDGHRGRGVIRKAEQAADRVGGGDDRVGTLLLHQRRVLLLPDGRDDPGVGVELAHGQCR